MRRAHPKTMVLGGLLGGLGVGVCDGLQAGVRAHVAFWHLPASSLLAGAVDLLVGFLLAVTVVVVLGLARWGRRHRYTPNTNLATYVLLGAAVAAATGAAVRATDGWTDRFLAALLVALAAGVTGTVGGLVGPALARALGPFVLKLRESEPTVVTQPPRSTLAGRVLLAPVVAAALTAVVMAAAWAPPGWPTRGLRSFRVFVCAALAALIPWGIVFASGRLSRIRRQVAIPAAIVLFAVPLVVVVHRSWAAHLQFLPWRDLRILLLLVVAGVVGVGLLQGMREPRERVRAALSALLVAGAPGAVLLTLMTGASTAARRATTLHAGLVAPLLGFVRPALDFDRDGYAGMLGGGDCKDSDARINPGARDWPGDGIDQDCDGQDLSLDALKPPPPPALPAGVPPDLNVLLVVVSGLRADHLGCYGYKRATSPELDRLAADGVLFESGWSHAPATPLAMAAIQTGRWPATVDWSCAAGAPALGPAQRTVAEVLRQREYVTAAFYAHDYFHRNYGRGFERGVGFYEDRRATQDRKPAAAGPLTGSSAREMVDDVLDFLHVYGDGQWKFFVTLHLTDPDLGSTPHPGAPEFGRAPADLYDGVVWFTDHQLGRVIARLKEQGLYDRTAIFVTADHGGGLLEPGLVRGASLAASQTHVPFIVRVPGVAARRVKAPVGHVDIAPSLLNVARIDPEPSFLGRSVLDLMTGAGDEARAADPAFASISAPPPNDPTGRPIERCAAASATHHLVWRRPSEDDVACYDIAGDPAERNDLWATRKGERACSALSLALRRRLSLMPAAGPSAELLIELAGTFSAHNLPAAEPQISRRVRFGNAATFVGQDLATGQAGAGPVRLAPCGRLEVTTHFEVSRSLPSWRLFVEIEGPAGTARGQGRPVTLATFPVDDWRSGHRIRHRFGITASARQPRGVYDVYLGFAQPAPGTERLPLTPAQAPDGPTRLHLLSFSVQ